MVQEHYKFQKLDIFSSEPRNRPFVRQNYKSKIIAVVASEVYFRDVEVDSEVSDHIFQHQFNGQINSRITLNESKLDRKIFKVTHTKKR